MGPVETRKSGRLETDRKGKPKKTGQDSEVHIATERRQVDAGGLIADMEASLWIVALLGWRIWNVPCLFLKKLDIFGQFSTI